VYCREVADLDCRGVADLGYRRMAALGCRKVADGDCLEVAGLGRQEVADLNYHEDIYQGLPVLVSMSRCWPRLISYHVVGPQRRQQRT
jgi:hypothetical protein